MVSKRGKKRLCVLVYPCMHKEFLSKKRVPLVMNIINYAHMFENRVLRKIFGHKREEIKGTGGNCLARCFITSALH
jgi:hypothetical protein